MEVVENSHQFSELLRAQQERRSQLKQQRQSINEETKNPEEMIAVVESAFSRFCSNLESEFDKLKSEEILERETLNVLWDSLADLREYFSQVSFSLATYDQWNFKNKIVSLENTILELSKKIPRTKFRFRRRKRREEEDKKMNSEQEEVKAKEIIDTLKGITNKENEVITLTQKDLSDNYKLVDLKNCKVKLQGKINCLFMKNLENCEIHTCPVANSIMIHSANDCTITIIGHQIRLHDSVRTRFNVITTSRLIIENCKQLKFAESTYKYDGYEQDLQISGLAGKVNLWREVQDFHWIKQEKSPNFELVEKEQVLVAPKNEESSDDEI